MKKALLVLAALVLAAAAYLAFAPIPIAPRFYAAPADRGYTGPFARNNRLAALELVDLGAGGGPEDGAVDAQGTLHVSLSNGDIVAIDPQSGRASRFTNTGGAPLGLEFDAQGTLWVADAYRGLLSIAKDGSVSVRAAVADGVPIRFADDVAVARDGTVYFSDASTKFGAKEFGPSPASLLDIMEHGLYGRVLRHDPKTGHTDVVRRNLSFANGVALTEDDSLLLISETGMNRVLGLHLKGARAGKLDVLIDSLPGFPDNIERGQNGRFWVGLVSPRSKDLDSLASRPGVRALVLRLPAAVRPKDAESSHVFAIDATGRVLDDLQDPSAAYAHVTGAVETPGALWVTSLTEPKLGKLRWPD